MDVQLLIAVPLLASLASALVRKDVRVLCGIAMGASVIEFLAMLSIAGTVIREGGYRMTDYFAIDALGCILVMLLALVGGSATWYSARYLSHEVEKNIIGPSRVRQYFILLHLFLFAMFFAAVTTSPILTWTAIETTTLSTAFLISFYNKPSAIEAAWKYLIINSVGLLCGFFGTLLFFYPTVHAGNQGFITWQNLMENASGFDPIILKMAFVFVLIGYGTKVGLAPMHTWLPDAHSKAPAPISSLLSGVLLNVAFVAILRFKSVTDAAIGPLFTRELLVFLGIASIVIAAFIMFLQKNYKRLFAYSSIEHMGIITLGFGFGGTGAFAGLLHMIYHSLAKSALFLTAGNILLKYHSTKMGKVRGMLRALPVTSVLFLIGLLAIMGLPPFGMFLTEFTILSAGMRDYPAATVMALLALALVVAGVLKHIVGMVFGTQEPALPSGELGRGTVIPIIVLLGCLAILSVFIPESLSALLHAATMNH